MASFDIDVLTQLAFSISENKGVFAVLIGSGLSRSANIPTGWEITLDLIRRVAAAQDVTDQPDWATWYVKTTGSPPNYSKLLESLAITPAERRAILHSYIEPNEEDRAARRKTPTAAHYAIADMVAAGHIRVLVTTNFDRLMETALRERGIEPTVTDMKLSRPFSFSVSTNFQNCRRRSKNTLGNNLPRRFKVASDGDEEAMRSLAHSIARRSSPNFWTRGLPEDRTTSSSSS